jgi:uncharacterized protein (TIGR00255 family)
MTGFGAADGIVGRTHVSVEIRTVNHRFFNPSIKLPTAFARWEGEVRDSVRRGVTRGHATVLVRTQRDADAPPAEIDDARFAEYVSRLESLKKSHSLAGPIEIETILRLPGVVVSEREDTPVDTDGPELVAIVDAAVAAMTTMREAEGSRLAVYLAERLSIVNAAVERLTARAPDRLLKARDRLHDAVLTLTDGVPLDEQRLSQEIAILADRLDVSEELDRFTSHMAAFRATLRGGAADGVGKRLGFLVQEMLREANTTGSKANDAPMLEDVIVIKEELERIREQADNLE